MDYMPFDKMPFPVRPMRLSAPRSRFRHRRRYVNLPQHPPSHPPSHQPIAHPVERLAPIGMAASGGCDLFRMRLPRDRASRDIDRAPFASRQHALDAHNFRHGPNAMLCQRPEKSGRSGAWKSRPVARARRGGMLRRRLHQGRSTSHPVWNGCLMSCSSTAWKATGKSFLV